MSAIRAGDLVMLVRGHPCVVERAGGVPFKVDAVRVARGYAGWNCRVCGTDPIKERASKRFVVFQRIHIPLSWLARIDPLTEPDAIPTTKTEPVAA